MYHEDLASTILRVQSKKLIGSSVKTKGDSFPLGTLFTDLNFLRSFSGPIAYRKTEHLRRFVVEAGLLTTASIESAGTVHSDEIF